MGEKAHGEGTQHGEFCSRRKSGECCDGNVYNKCCDAAELKKAWGTGKSDAYEFAESAKGPRKLEAHHLCCVASVTEHLVGGDKGDTPVIEIIKLTKWCINKESNMIALPLWGHTIKWYCDLETKGAKVLDRIDEVPDKAPPFENWPQHDYDHNSANGYKKKHVDAKMIELAGQIDKAKKKHKAEAKKLEKALDTASDDFRDMLETNGKGTHAAWKRGPKKPDGDWYKPFSMADPGDAEPRTFPVAGGGKEKVWNKIDRLAKAFQKWGST